MERLLASGMTQSVQTMSDSNLAVLTGADHRSLFKREYLVSIA